MSSILEVLFPNLMRERLGKLKAIGEVNKVQLTALFCVMGTNLMKTTIGA